MEPGHNFQATIVFCDGACSGNPGPGGWGSIVVRPDGQVRELGSGARQTTNNKMEMTAALEALNFLSHTPGEVIVYTDSVYVIRGITQWIWGWLRRGWKTANNDDVSNKELWQELHQTVSKRAKQDKITWKYVRGHTGVPGNERCDEIAVAFTKNLRIDLYKGSLLGYPVPVLDLPPDQPIPEGRSNNEPKPKAFSYVSVVGGVPARHTTWPECERRVKGQPGAKFKKATSAADEAAILRSWGVDPKKLS